MGLKMGPEILTLLFSSSFSSLLFSSLPCTVHTQKMGPKMLMFDLIQFVLFMFNLIRKWVVCVLFLLLFIPRWRNNLLCCCCCCCCVAGKRMIEERYWKREWGFTITLMKIVVVKMKFFFNIFYFKKINDILF